MQSDAVSAVIAGRSEESAIHSCPRTSVITDAVYGRSLLHLAAANGCVPIAEILISAGSNLQAQDVWGLSPLGHAMLWQRTEAANMLRERGAAENLFDAVYADHLSVAESLLSKNKSLAQATNALGMSVAEVAASIGDANLLKLLLNKGAPADFVNARDGRTPLHAAAICNRSESAALLIRSGAKVEVPDKHGLTPLHLAAIQGSTEVAELLLKHKANPSAPIVAPSGLSSRPAMPLSTLAGYSALHLAVFSGQTNIIELLLKSGASVNATNSAGMTALRSSHPARFAIAL